MRTITIWSDVACPWSYVACLRLHRMRDHLGASRVEFDFRALPHELMKDGLADAHRARHEVAALAQREHRAFSALDGWPSTTLFAFEAQKWAYSLSQEMGEKFDLALRRAIFLHGHDMSKRRELLGVAEAEGLDAPALAAALDEGRFRKAVADDVAAARELGITDTPVVVLPDGTAHINPGMTVEWVRGIPVVTADHPGVYEEIIRNAATDD